MDVRKAFLYGDLKEEIYMEMPLGLKVMGINNHACKLKKFFYGLKQFSWACYAKLSSNLIEEGFTRCTADHSMFIKSH